MKGKQFKEKPACSVRSAQLQTEVTCPHCGFEIEIWSGEDKTMCKVCGYGVFKHEDITN